MGYTLTMAVVETLQYLPENFSCLVFREELVLNDSVEELSTLASFSYEVDVLLLIEILEQFKHVWVIKLLQDLNF